MASLPDEIDSKLEPRMILGWRKSNQLKGCRVNLDENVFDVMRDVSSVCLDVVRSATIREYESFAQADEGEIFRIDSSTPASSLDSSSLISLIRNSATLQTLRRDEIGTDFQFYAIVWGDPGSELAFIRKKNARTGLNQGMRFFKYYETLHEVETPDFVLDEEVDILFYDDSLYVLREFSASVLLNDTGIAVASVPRNISQLTRILGGDSKVTSTALRVMTDAAQQKKTMARRIAKMVEFFDGRLIDTGKLRTVALDQCDDPDELVDANDIICVTDSGRVAELCDLIEGRYYEDGVTEESRRADRVSRRKR